jgi:hypothetical protein
VGVAKKAATETGVTERQMRRLPRKRRRKAERALLSIRRCLMISRLLFDQSPAAQSLRFRLHVAQASIESSFRLRQKQVNGGDCQWLERHGLAP